MAHNHDRLNVSAGLASVAVALFLVALKLWALAQTGSLAVATSLADSGLDLMVSAAGLAAIIYAAKPADADHTFGHTAAEDLAALGQALFIVVSALVIAVAAVRRLVSDSAAPLASENAGIAVMLLSIAVTLALLWWQRRVIARTGSKVVAADSMHYLGDLIPALGAIVALFASGRFGLGDIDSVVALGAAAFMAVGALRIGRRAWDALMDRTTDPSVVARIAQIAGDFPGVLGYHDLRMRQSGSRIFVNLHIELDGSRTLDETHAVCAALRRTIVREYPDADVIIHQDPVGVQRHPDDRRAHPDG